MPKIEPGQSSDAKQQLYGVAPSDNTLTFRDRLVQRFKAQDFVTVKNVDDEPFTWQYLPEQEEDVQHTPDGTQTIVFRGQPELWQIQPGAVETIVGANAYIMIEGLYKKLAAKKRIDETPDQPKAVARNFNFSDAGAQERWIDQIYQGKATLRFGQSQTDTTKPMAAAEEQKEVASVGAKK